MQKESPICLLINIIFYLLRLFHILHIGNSYEEGKIKINECISIFANCFSVKKALKVLEKQGLIVSRGSKGYFVIDSDQKIIELKNQDLNRLIKILFEKLYALGFSDSEIIKLFDRIETKKNE